MVKLSAVYDYNQTLRALRHDVTVVVVGGTNGIGRGFLLALASHLVAPKIYILGRKREALDNTIHDLKIQNSKGTYVPILTGDLTLLSETEKAAASIVAQASCIDILFMSQGYLNMGARDESAEGIDKLTCIRHYSRALLTMRLLPLLEQAPNPRVVSVLAGGLEGAIYPDDLALESPRNYGFAKASGAAATYITLTMEQLHKEHAKISFIHAFPGLVRTNLLHTEHFGTAFKFVVGSIVLPTLGRLIFMPAEEAGQRLLYAAFNPAFATNAETKGSNGSSGSGVFTLNEKQESVQNSKVLSPLRKQGLAAKIWEHTLGEIRRVLGDDSLN